MRDKPTWRESANDSLIVRNVDPTTVVRYKGERDSAARYLPIARVMLGNTINRAKLGGIAYNAMDVTLPDGTRIITTTNSGQHVITIEAAKGIPPGIVQSVKPFFIIYPCSSTQPYGYGIDEDGNVKNREYPYRMEEPVLKVFEDLQFPCSSKLFYRWATPNEYTVQHPYHYPYGNQYAAIGKDVFTWWGSGYGDLPILNVGTYSEATRFNQLYMPILCVEEQVPYIYLAQKFYGIYPVDNRLYANGKAVAQLPHGTGRAIIAGVGRRDNGDLIIAVAAVKAYEFLLYRNKQLTRIGELFPVDGYADRTIAFDDNATKAALLCELTPDTITHNIPPAETLHCVTFSITYVGEVYSWTVASSLAYYQDYSNKIEVSSVVENSVEFDEEYLIYTSQINKFYNYADSTRTYTTSTRFPVAIYYNQGELKYIEMDSSSELIEYGRSGVKNDSFKNTVYVWPGVIGYANVNGVSTSKSGTYYETTEKIATKLYIGGVDIGDFGNVDQSGTWETFASHPGLVGRTESQTTQVIVMASSDAPPVDCYETYKCNHYGIVDYALHENLSVVKREVDEKRDAVLSYLRYIDAKKQFVVHHQLSVEAECVGADEESTKRKTIRHYSFIIGGVSWDSLHTVETYDVAPSGREFDSLEEKIVSSFVITYLHADRSIKRRTFSERTLLDKKITSDVSSGLATTPQLLSYNRYTEPEDSVNKRAVPTIHSLIDHPYWLATLSYRVDPTLTDVGNKYESVLEAKYTRPSSVDNLIYLGNEYGLFYAPGPSAIYGRDGSIEYSYREQAPTVSSFSAASEGVGQIYPIGWGFKRIYTPETE